MELNCIVDGIEMVGTVIKDLSVKNNIVDIGKDARKSFGLNINEPTFEKIENAVIAQVAIHFQIELEQEENKCSIELVLEGAFLSRNCLNEDAFKQLVILNGVAALIGIARGKIETLSAGIFNKGKIVIPFINVMDYYKSLAEDSAK